MLLVSCFRLLAEFFELRERLVTFDHFPSTSLLFVRANGTVPCDDVVAILLAEMRTGLLRRLRHSHELFLQRSIFDSSSVPAPREVEHLEGKIASTPVEVLELLILSLFQTSQDIMRGRMFLDLSGSLQRRGLWLLGTFRLQCCIPDTRMLLKLGALTRLIQDVSDWGPFLKDRDLPCFLASHHSSSWLSVVLRYEQIAGC